MFKIVKLAGRTQNELNTELRFLFASARVDGVELLRLDMPLENDEREDKRINSCVIKVLRCLKKDGVIQFYVNRESFLASSTESIFLQNKYPEHIGMSAHNSESIFIKL